MPRMNDIKPAKPTTTAERQSALEFALAELRTVLDLGPGNSAAWAGVQTRSSALHPDRLWTLTVYLSPEWRVGRLRPGCIYRVGMTNYFSKVGARRQLLAHENAWLKDAIVPPTDLRLIDCATPFSEFVQ